MISLTVRKLRKGKVEQIADELEADMETIAPICQAAKVAP